MKDDVFIRGDVPMTKSEVRAVTLSKLELYQNAVIYDVGAGTGSISVEAAMLMTGGHVYSIEHKQEAIDLICQNKEKFKVHNLTVVGKKAPEAFEGLEAPTHAVIGGSSGNMVSILEQLLAKNPKIRIVINVIALETLAEVVSWIKSQRIDAEIVSVTVARARKAGSYHLMQGQNPVYIITLGDREDD